MDGMCYSLLLNKLLALKHTLHVYTLHITRSNFDGKNNFWGNITRAN